jgi:hypothetical protein
VDHRTIPIEVLRDFAMTQVELTSTRQAAVEAGIGRTTLHAFIWQTSKTHPRVRRRLALWYLDKIAIAADVDVVRPYAASLHVLLAEMAPEQRERAEPLVIAALQSGFDLGPVGRPRWLTILATPSEARSLTIAEVSS